MLHRMHYSFILAVLTTLISTMSYAFNAETDCPSSISVSTQADIINALSAVSLKDDRYVICFNGDVQIASTLHITGKEKPLIVHGLSLLPLKDSRTGLYSGLFLSVAGSGPGITFQNLKIGSESLPATSALSITGSNVSVIDSQIHASQTGIAVGTKEIAAENVVIAGTTVVGPEPIDANSRAIVISDNSQKVEVSAQSLLEDFDLGVDGKAELDHISFQNVATPIRNDGNMIDATKVAKRLDVKDATKVTAILGPAPAGCSADTTGSKVDLYVRDDVDTVKFIQMSPCNIQTSSEAMCIAADNAAPATCTKETADLPAGSCVFECSVNFTNQDKWIKLGFKDQIGISHTLTDDLLVRDLGRISTFAPPVSLPTPIGAGMTGDQGSENQTQDIMSEAGDVGGVIVEVTRVDNSGTGMTKAGCNLIHQDAAGHPSVIWFIVGATGLSMIARWRFWANRRTA